MILEAIRTLLISDPGVSAITTRITPNVLPQGATLPAITYYRISGVAFEALARNSKMTRGRFQIDAFARSCEDADALGDAVRLALQKIPPTDVNGQIIQEISLTSGPMDLVDPPELGDDARRYIQSQDFLVFYKPTV